EEFTDRLLRGPARRPLVTLLISGAIIALAIASITRLQPMTSLQSMMDNSEPSARALGRILSDFGSVDKLLLVASLSDNNTHDKDALAEFGSRLEQAAAD